MLTAAHADTGVTTFDGKEIKDLCTISTSGQSCPVFPAPPELLNAAAVDAAGPEVAASMRRLEDRAVTNTLADHQLPASDDDAVLSWGRAEAQGELWALIVTAIATAASDRTVDQQHAVDWMAGLVSAQSNESALHAAAEYTTWAGLDVHRYWNMARTATRAGLTTFLSEPVRAYSPENSPRGGYCRYTAPDPDSGAYDGSMAAACYQACPSVQQCGYPVPKYDDFVSWGENAATYSAIQDPSFAGQAVAVATASSLVVAAAAAGIGQLSVPLTGQAIAMLAIAANQALTALTGSGSWALMDLGIAGASATITLAGAAIGSILVVIAAVVIGTLEGIRVFDNEALPGKLADLVVGARSATSDPASLIGTTDGATALFDLFVGATLPAPRLGLGCDNSLIPPWAYTSSGDPSLLVYVPLGQHDTVTSPVDGHGCLNPPLIPPAEQSDPHFVVTDLSDHTERVSPTLTLGDAKGAPAVQVRIHGSWFVARDLQGGTSGQWLQLRYLDTSGNLRVAWLVRDHGAYRFLGVDASSASSIDPDTCKADGTCWERTTIDYLGPDGRKLAARVEPYQAPVGTPTYSPTTPVEGSPVTFDARDFAPGDGTHLTYTWRFQRLGCGWLPCWLAGQHDADNRAVPSYSAPVTGRTATYTWQSMGPAKVELTATDPVGRTAQTTFTVNVGNVAPTLTLDHPDDTAQAGLPFSLAARFADAGDSDDENVEITWGDGHQDTVKAGPDSVNLLDGYHPDVTQLDPTTYALSAHHTYTRPGIYYGTVQVSDWGAAPTRPPSPSPSASDVPPGAPPAEAPGRFGDVIELKRGDEIPLARDDGTPLGRLTMGLGWDRKAGAGFIGTGAPDVDLDASAFQYADGPALRPRVLQPSGDPRRGRTAPRRQHQRPRRRRRRADLGRPREGLPPGRHDALPRQQLPGSQPGVRAPRLLPPPRRRRRPTSPTAPSSRASR